MCTFQIIQNSSYERDIFAPKPVNCKFKGRVAILISTTTDQTVSNSTSQKLRNQTFKTTTNTKSG